MKTIALAILCLLTGMTGHAQEAVKILDKVSAEYKKCASVTAQFEISSGDDIDKGTILLQGKKFCTTLSNTTTWFDGKTMWSYVKDNQEVNVTEPKANQLAKINPYAFLDIYKQGYNVTMGNSTTVYYEVVMTATNNKSSIQKALIRINRNDYTPKYIMMGGAKSKLEISVLSYKKGSKQADTAFRFDKKKYPKVDVIDLR